MLVNWANGKNTLNYSYKSRRKKPQDKNKKKSKSGTVDFLTKRAIVGHVKKRDPKKGSAQEPAEWPQGRGQLPRE